MTTEISYKWCAIRPTAKQRELIWDTQMDECRKLTREFIEKNDVHTRPGQEGVQQLRLQQLDRTFLTVFIPENLKLIEIETKVYGQGHSTHKS